MARKKEKKLADESQPKVLKPNHTHGAEVGAVAGEVAGGLVGSLAGPPGAVAGMVIGAIAGTLVGGVMDDEAKRAHIHDEDLDEEIGVTSGEIGAPNLRHPAEGTSAIAAGAPAIEGGAGGRAGPRR